MNAYGKVIKYGDNVDTTSLSLQDTLTLLTKRNLPPTAWKTLILISRTR